MCLLSQALLLLFCPPPRDDIVRGSLLDADALHLDVPAAKTMRNKLSTCSSLLQQHKMDGDRKELSDRKRFKIYWNVRLQDLIPFLKADVERGLWVNEGFSFDEIWGSSSLFTNLVSPNSLHTLSQGRLAKLHPDGHLSEIF